MMKRSVTISVLGLVCLVSLFSIVGCRGEDKEFDAALSSFDRGTMLLKAGKYEEALVEYERAKRINPSWATLQDNIDLASKLQELTERTKLKGEASDKARHELCEYYVGSRDYEKALACAEGISDSHMRKAVLNMINRHLAAPQKPSKPLSED